MRDIPSIDEFLSESSEIGLPAGYGATERRLTAALEWLMVRNGYAPDRVWVDWHREGRVPPYPSVYAELDKLSEDGPTKDSGEINYAKVRRMEVQLRDRLGLRSAPEIGQYTKNMGYPDIADGKLWVEVNL